jgi:DNA-binding IclR family transcriptional regulator
MSKDDLFEQLDLPISEANTLLTVLELKGLITEKLGEIRLT